VKKEAGRLIAVLLPERVETASAPVGVGEPANGNVVAKGEFLWDQKQK
jgi:hypothetical protein